MSWRPERGWVSLGARVGAAAGGVAVLVAGLATGPTPLVADSPKDRTVSRIESDQPRAARPLIRQGRQERVEPTRVGERVAARAPGVRVDASRVDDQISEVSVTDNDRGGETANDVGPVPSSGGHQSGSSGSSGGDPPADSDHSGTAGDDDPPGSGGGPDGDSDDTDPDDTDPDPDPDGTEEDDDTPDASGDDGENGDDDES